MDINDIRKKVCSKCWKTQCICQNLSHHAAASISTERLRFEIAPLLSPLLLVLEYRLSHVGDLHEREREREKEREREHAHARARASERESESQRTRARETEKERVEGGARQSDTYC